MKKSKAVKLVLVASIAISCSDHHPDKSDNRLYVRGDSASNYTSHPSYWHGGGYFWFHPYGYYSWNGGYRHSGYESPHFSSRASAHVSRGGFGSSGFRVGS
ncbi:MAG: hypothetical protein Q8928_15885 [Bacteroidota bacterium]|nr:hypothetical protein [Bacteroidota bacterium]